MLFDKSKYSANIVPLRPDIRARDLVNQEMKNWPEANKWNLSKAKV